MLLNLLTQMVLSFHNVFWNTQMTWIDDYDDLTTINLLDRHDELAIKNEISLGTFISSLKKRKLWGQSISLPLCMDIPVPKYQSADEIWVTTAWTNWLRFDLFLRAWHSCHFPNILKNQSKWLLAQRADEHKLLHA